METSIVYWGCTWIMDKKMVTTIIYWGSIIGINEEKMETTISFGTTSHMLAWLMVDEL